MEFAIVPLGAWPDLWRSRMKHSVEIDQSAGVIRVRTLGTIQRPRDSLFLLQIAGEAVKEHGVSRVLFDLRESTIVGTLMGAYQTALNPEEHGVSRRIRIAVVYPVITKDEQFMENVGVNRGSVAFKVFDDIDKAQEWIVQ